MLCSFSFLGPVFHPASLPFTLVYIYDTMCLFCCRAAARRLFHRKTRIGRCVIIINCISRRGVRHTFFYDFSYAFDYTIAQKDINSGECLLFVCRSYGQKSSVRDHYCWVQQRRKRKTSRSEAVRIQRARNFTSNASRCDWWLKSLYIDRLHCIGISRFVRMTDACVRCCCYLIIPLAGQLWSHECVIFNCSEPEMDTYP